MNIGEAIEWTKAGTPVARKSWSNERFIYYVPKSTYDAMTEVAKKIQNEEGKVDYNAYIALHKSDGSVSMYVATQEDLLATDWVKYAI